MATRTSIRPRPLDVNKQLIIVRDISELDGWEGGLPKELQDPSAAVSNDANAVTAPAAADAASQQANSNAALTSPPHAKKPKQKEIPVPEVKEVATYTRDYLPTFKIPDTYIHGKGGTNYATTDYVEYDLDNEDEDWLEAFNRHDDNRLSDTKFERMLWRLELAWSEAADTATSAADRMSAPVLASTACLPKVAAINVLKKSVGGRDIILEQVYEYWVAKRKKWAKPILRRLQAPTNPTDTNPYNVFRPREKANRPLTRRRRENSTECLEKLRQIRENIIRALELAELVILRERKKSAMHHADITAQRYQLNIAHQSPTMHPQLEQQALAGLRELAARSSLADPRIASFMEIQAGAPITGLDVGVQRALARKRKRLDSELLSTLAVASSEALTKLPFPIPQPEPEPLWAYEPNLIDIPAQQQAKHAKIQPEPAMYIPENVQVELTTGTMQAYVGRGGRVVIARCDPLTLDPLTQDDHRSGSHGGAARNGPVTSQPPDGQPQQPPTELPDALVYSFQSSQPKPWALAFDLALLPDYIDKAPILAARQQWAALQEQAYKAASIAGVHGLPAAGGRSRHIPGSAAGSLEQRASDGGQLTGRLSASGVSVSGSGGLSKALQATKTSSGGFQINKGSGGRVVKQKGTTGDLGLPHVE